MESLNPQVVADAKLPILNPNEFDIWKMRIEQYFLMTDYSLWDVILNEQRLAKINELKAGGTLLMAFPDKYKLNFNIHKDAKSLMEAIEKRFGDDLEEQSLDDLFNNLKIYEAEVKGSFPSSQNTQNIAFVSSNNTDSLNESVTAAPSISAVSSKATVSILSNCDAVGGYDLSFQADEEPTNYALMAYTSSGSSSSSRSDNENLERNLKRLKKRNDLKLTLDKFQTSSKNPSKLLESQVSDKTGLGFDSQVFNCQVSVCKELHSHESDNRVSKNLEHDSELVGNVFNVESSTHNPSKNMSKTHRSDASIVEDWVSDSKDETEIESVPKQREPSFVTSTEHMKSSRESVKKVEHHKQAANLRTTNQKSRGHKTNWNNKACFVCGSLNHLIKDYDYYEKQLVQKPMSRLMSLNAAIPIPTTVTQLTVKSPRPIKHVVNKAHSPVRKPIGQRTATKNSNFNKKVTSVKANKVNVVQGNKDNAKKPQHTRVPRENNMYNVDLKNVVPSGGLTCLFSKATLDESNLWHMRLGHINFKTMNKLVKGNLVRGLPSKIFKNNHTYVACQKGKQHRASFCRMKGIKREFCVARTPQQNRVAERTNRTLIEAARTMLVDSLLLIPFWAEAVNTACYVQNRETLHINFLENKPNVAGIGPKWLFDVDTLTMSMNYQSVVIGNQPNDNAGIKENLDVGKVGKETIFAQQYVLLPLWSTGSQDLQNTDDDVPDAAFDVKENKNDVHVSANGSDNTDNKKHDKKAKRDDKEKSLVDSLTGVRDLSAEFKEFSFNSSNRVNAISAPVNVDGPNPTSSTNSFNTVSPSVNAVSLNFRIARKSSFVDPSKYPDDLDMPELEDIVYSYDEEDGHTQDEGIYYDEVFAPVARIEAIRLILAYSSFMGFMVYQMDVKSAFLYGTIEEEVYVCQPSGFEDLDYPDKTLFIKKQKGDILLVHVYVDDIIFGSTNKELCKAFEKLMKDKFQMSSMGGLTFFLGLQVKQKDDEIFISQDKYVAKILRKFGFTDVKSASTPIETKKPLLKDPDGEDVDVHIYRSMIGSLMYLTSSRPDIMFVVCACARFQVTPKVSHLHAVKRIFRHLKGKPHLELWYPRDSSLIWLHILIVTMLELALIESPQ
nr:hypothetical protein [Tanacetum cinerariifolium]